MDCRHGAIRRDGLFGRLWNLVPRVMATLPESDDVHILGLADYSSFGFSLHLGGNDGHRQIGACPAGTLISYAR